MKKYYGSNEGFNRESNSFTIMLKQDFARHNVALFVFYRVVRWGESERQYSQVNCLLIFHSTSIATVYLPISLVS